MWRSTAECGGVRRSVAECWPLQRIAALLCGEVRRSVDRIDLHPIQVRQKLGLVRNFMLSEELPVDLQQRCYRHLQHFMLERPKVQLAPLALGKARCGRCYGRSAVSRRGGITCPSLPSLRFVSRTAPP